MATHSSILAWKIPWTSRGAWQSMGSCKELHVTEHTHRHTHTTPGSLLQRFSNGIIYCACQTSQTVEPLKFLHGMQHPFCSLAHLPKYLAPSCCVFSSIKGTHVIMEYFQNKRRYADNNNHSEAHYRKIGVQRLVYFLPVHLFDQVLSKVLVSNQVGWA